MLMKLILRLRVVLWSFSTSSINFLIFKKAILLITLEKLTWFAIIMRIKRNCWEIWNFVLSWRENKNRAIWMNWKAHTSLSMYHEKSDNRDIIINYQRKWKAWKILFIIFLSQFSMSGSVLSLQKAFQKEFSNATQGKCFSHLKQNVKKSAPKSISKRRRFLLHFRSFHWWGRTWFIVEAI